MFEKFTTADARDFRQRYQGSYGFFRNGERRHLVKLTNINHEYDPPRVIFIDKDRIEYTLHADTDRDDVGFEFLPPRSSWKNTWEFGAVLGCRLARRQWIRGLHDSNTTFVIPRIKTIPVDFPILIELFLKPPPSFMEAYTRMTELLKTKNVRSYAAINDSFALDWESNLYCYDRLIGTYKVDAGNFIVTLKESMFFTEVCDAFHRQNVVAVVK